MSDSFPKQPSQAPRQAAWVQRGVPGEPFSHSMREWFAREEPGFRVEWFASGAYCSFGRAHNTTRADGPRYEVTVMIGFER